MNKITKISVGVDVSKEKLDVFMYPIEKHLIVKNSKKGYKKLIEIFSAYDIKQVVCESSGGYENNFLRIIDQFGYSTWQVDPKRIKAFVISEGIKVKTDKMDSKMIALFAYNKMGEHSPRCTFSKEQLMLRALINRKEELKDQISNEKKRLRRPATQCYCKAQIKNHIKFMKKQIKELEKKIDKMIENDDDWQNKAKIMESVPGVGKTTARILIASMPELGSLDNKKAASLLGVAPFTRQSGKYVGIAKIKGGRPTPRKAIYMAALTASRYNPKLKVFYNKLIDAGKKPKVAIVALMRKLIIILNTMVKNETLWAY